MASAEPFPLFFPPDARRAFHSDDVTRRLARAMHWGNGIRVLELACGATPATLPLAKELGCLVVLADDDAQALERVRERVKSSGVSDRVEVKSVDFSKLDFSDGQFDAIFALGRVLFPLEEGVQSLRRHLASRGRLCVTYPLKVGRFPAKAPMEHWERHLGEPLRLPRECLQLFERHGYEPETVETLADPELDELYRGLEPHLGEDPKSQLLKDELELHRAAQGKGSFTYGLLIGRRKEPGEAPPVSRNE